MTETAMMVAGSSLLVTASAEQTPNICTVTGLFLLNGLQNISLLLNFILALFLSLLA